VTLIRRNARAGLPPNRSPDHDNLSLDGSGYLMNSMENYRQFSKIADWKATGAVANCHRSRACSYATECDWRRKAECSPEVSVTG
jgi:hypothetical protein